MSLSALWLLLATAVPDGADAALAQLARYQDAPKCVYGPHGSPATDKLVGKSTELAAYALHWSRAVKLRAAELLCVCPDVAATKLLRELAEANPCEPRFAKLANLEPKFTSCPKLEELIEWDVRVATWSKRAAPGLGAKLSAHDRAAWKAAEAALTTDDSDRLEATLGAMAKVDDPLAFLDLIDLLERAGGERNRSMLRAAMHGVGQLSLDAVAAKRKTDRLGALIEVIRVARPADVPRLQELPRDTIPTLTEALALAAPRERKRPGASATGAAFLDTLGGDDNDAWLKIRSWANEQETDELRAYVDDLGNPWKHRVDAGLELAKLGDLRGLKLFEHPEGLWPEERAQRKSWLERYQREGGGAAAGPAAKLLATRWQ